MPPYQLLQVWQHRQQLGFDQQRAPDTIARAGQAAKGRTMQWQAAIDVSEILSSDLSGQNTNKLDDLECTPSDYAFLLLPQSIYPDRCD